ncbi:hypothetical protein [Clostridium intestinale]|uniref:hypothetical protein n=1 Tax=Clostridium intestinale TaxID=36845 RepID=UPI002DD653E4|nr:hypothetical protein [Clostridium intestinale]WRY53914.1 hypothetical protein P8F83_12035 [Clostridium intestinale]
MSDKLLSLVWEWRYIVIVVAAVAVYSLFEWQRAKVKAYSLMLQAKRLAKDAFLKSGKQQEEWVVKKMQQFLPKPITLFISEELMFKIVDFLYVKAKDYIDDGEFNNSVSE